jgi:hypothetical protein
VRASHSLFGLSPFVHEDVVAISSSDTDEALEFLMLESERGNSPRPSLNDMRRTSSESSMGSEWFEDWHEANDMAASVYVVLITEPSLPHQDSGRSRARVSKVVSTYGDRQPTR